MQARSKQKWSGIAKFSTHSTEGGWEADNY